MWFIDRKDTICVLLLIGSVAFAAAGLWSAARKIGERSSPQLAAPTQAQIDMVIKFYNECGSERTKSVAVEGGVFSVKATCMEDVRWQPVKP